MNYKNAFYTLLAVNCAYLGFMVRHDSYNLFIAVAAVLFSYGIVCLVMRKKAWMLSWFVVLSVCLCQGAITARQNLMYPDEKVSTSTGSLVGDLAYAVRTTPGNFNGLKSAWVETADNEYGGFNKLNYSLLVLGLCIPLPALSLIFRRRGSVKV